MSDDKAPSGWQPIDTLPEMEKRPGRMIIRVEGWKTHDWGTIMFARVYYDTAGISNETHWGFRQSDLDRIMKDGDMDGIDAITDWHPLPPPKESTP